MSAPFAKPRAKEPYDGVLMFHIHGGGFMAMSPASHESYLRKWAVDTHIPIISIDYKKAPETKWPALPEECYAAYKWVVNNAERFLPQGQKLKKIIVTGDSAGGNLSMAVTIRAIFDRFHIPDILALTYPASSISVAPSTARLTALTEPLVNLAFLEVCFHAYLPEEMKQTASYNVLVSPGVVPAEFLRQFPPTYINVGSLDPLLDDAVMTAKQIAKYNGNQVFFDVYDNLGHGYLNMAFELMPDCMEAVDNVSSWLNDFLDVSREEEE